MTNPLPPTSLLDEYREHYRTAESRGTVTPVTTITAGRVVERSSFIMPARERTGLSDELQDAVNAMSDEQALATLRELATISTAMYPQYAGRYGDEWVLRTLRKAWVSKGGRMEAGDKVIVHLGHRRHDGLDPHTMWGVRRGSDCAVGDEHLR